MIKPMSIRPLLLLLLCVAPCSSGEAADLLVVTSNPEAANDHYLRIAAEHYGLGMKVVTTNAEPDVSNALERMRDPNVLGVVILATDLSRLSPARVFAALNRQAGPVPLFVDGVDTKVSPQVLQAWSGGEIQQCR